MSWLIKIFRYLVLRGFQKYLLSAGLYYLALIKKPSDTLSDALSYQRGQSHFAGCNHLCYGFHSQ